MRDSFVVSPVVPASRKCFLAFPSPNTPPSKSKENEKNTCEGVDQLPVWCAQKTRLLENSKDRRPQTRYLTIMDRILHLTTHFRQTNVSLYTLPVAWLLCLAPRIYAAATYYSSTSNSPNFLHPRSLAQKAISDRTLDTRSKNRIVRAEAAQANGLENVGYFAAAVVAGNFAGLEKGVLNGLALGYLGSRLVFNWVYVINETSLWAGVRTAVFFAGQGMIFALFILAGNELR